MNSLAYQPGEDSFVARVKQLAKDMDSVAYCEPDGYTTTERTDTSLYRAYPGGRCERLIPLPSSTGLIGEKQ